MQHIGNEIRAVKKDLLDILSSYDNEKLNSTPFAGSWTPGQVAEHIQLSAAGVLRNVNSETKPTDRNPEEHVAMIRQIFLDMSHKMTSPDFIRPSEEKKDKEELLAAIGTVFDSIADATDRKDLSLTCTAFPMPNLGELTRVEWINFAAVHTQRHIHQLQNMNLV